VITTAMNNRIKTPTSRTARSGHDTLVSDRESRLESLIRQEHDNLRRFAFRLVSDDGDDVLQEAYLRVFRYWPRFDPSRGSPISWLYRIVYNEAVSDLRRKRRRPITSEKEAVSAGDAQMLANNRLDLAAALAELSPDHRAVVLLVDWLGFPYSEAAAILGVPEGTVSSRLNHARARVRANWRPMGTESR
jgi:RNA polymerase sigma-70 factor (ECF subfamily)